MIPKNLDLEDPLLRQLMERNHTPEEVGNSSVIKCSMDNQDWPCEVRVKLNETPKATKLREQLFEISRKYQDVVRAKALLQAELMECKFKLEQTKQKLRKEENSRRGWWSR